MIEGGKGKATILQVGFVDAEGRLGGWSFACDNDVPYLDVDDMGIVRVSGYTRDELRQIASEHSAGE